MSIICIDDLTFAYEGAPEPVFLGLTLELDDTWKLALTGRNGRGKTTLLKLLSGELDARGRIHAAARFARFPFAVEDATLPARAAMTAVCGAAAACAFPSFPRTPPSCAAICARWPGSAART